MPSIEITPFFGTGTGDPVKSLRRIAWQTQEGVPATSGFVDFLHDGGPVSIEALRLPRQAIRNSAMRQGDVPGKYAVEGVGPLSFGDLDAGSKAQMMTLLSNFQGYETTNPSTTHYRHRLSQTKSTKQLLPLTLLADSDLGIPIRLFDCRFSGFTLALGQRQNLTLSAPVASGPFDFNADAELDTGTGAVAPLLKHWSKYNWESTGDHVIFAKIISQDATTVNAQVKRGTAGSYSADQVFTKNTASRVYWKYVTGYGATIDDEERDKQLMLSFPAGTYVALDVWTFDNRRAVWSPSFAAERVVAEVQARFYVAGEIIPIDRSANLVMTLPGVVTRYGNSAMPAGTLRKGFQNPIFTLGRSLVDLTFQKAKMLRSSVALVVEAKNDLSVGSTPVKVGYTFTAPNLVATGRTWDVEPGGQNDEEQVVLEAKEPTSGYVSPVDGLTYTADLECTIDTEIATVAS